MDHFTSKPSRDQILEICDAVGSDDGLSPFELAKRSNREQRHSKSKRTHYRLLQLCRQVERGIDDSLWCDCCDPLLNSLRTIGVRPLSGSSALLATVITSESDTDTINLIHERLDAASGVIRASVAGVINRKRVPRIQFRVVFESREEHEQR